MVEHIVSDMTIEIVTNFSLASNEIIIFQLFIRSLIIIIIIGILTKIWHRT